MSNDYVFHLDFAMPINTKITPPIRNDSNYYENDTDMILTNESAS